MAAPAARTRFRRALLAVAALMGVAGSVSCADLFSGWKGGFANVVIIPKFSERDAAILASLDQFNLGVQTIRVVLTRPPANTDTLADTTVTLAEGQNEVIIQIQVRLDQPEELLRASMEMHSGTVLIFSGTTNVVARAVAASSVASTPPTLVPIWVGPGNQATRIVIAPRDLTIPFSGRVSFTATAFDANDAVVDDPEYTTRWQWVILDPTLAQFTPGTTELVGRGQAGIARVMVFTPNLLRDTVRVTLVGAIATSLTFTNGAEVVDLAGTKSAPATVRSQDGTPMPGVPVTYTSRSTGIATVSSAGVITGVAKGQAVIVANATGTTVTDSMIAVVGDVGGVAVLTGLEKMHYRTDTTITVSVLVDMRSSGKRLGSTALDIDWNPAQLQFQSFANGAGGVSPTVNASTASTGRLILAMADVAGFTGRVEMVRITFRTSVSPTSGDVRVTARELTATDYTDLLALTAQVVHPLSIP